MINNPLFKLKIAICGDFSSVRTLMDHFNPNLRDYTKFMGFSNATKLVKTKKFNAKFIIWSLEKSSYYFVKNLYNGSLGFIIPFDQTIKGSFDRISKYRMQFRGIPTFLVSNKADLVDETIVENEEIQEDFAELMKDEGDLHYAEINTNTGAGIDELFEKLAAIIIAKQNY